MEQKFCRLSLFDDLGDICHQRCLFVMITLAIILMTANEANAVQPVITPSPVVTTYLGGMINISCLKPNELMEVAWETALLPSFAFSINNGLHIQVSDIQYNNSLVYCVTRYKSQPATLYTSDPIMILIQDILGHPDLIKENIGLCTTMISWNPPYTLPGVPILGYVVYITNLDTGITNTNFTSNRDVTLSLDYNYMVSVAGVNGAGEGNKSVTNVTSFFNAIYGNVSKMTYGKARPSRLQKQWIVDVPLLEYKSQLEDILNDLNCYAQFYLSFVDNSTKLLYISNKTHISNEVLSNEPIDMPEDSYYYVSVSLQAFQSQRHVFTSNVTSLLSTYDVQNIENRTANNGSVCLYPDYVSGAFRKCGIQLICSNMSETNYTVEIKQCINNDNVMKSENCTLRGFDCERNSSNLWEGPAVIKTFMINVLSTDPTINTNLTDATTIVSDSTNSTDTTEPTNTMNSTNATDSTDITSTIIIVVAIVSIALLIVLIAIIVVALYKCKRNWDKNNETTPM